MTFKRALLEGEKVRLEPLDFSHQEGLSQAIQDGRLWEVFVTRVPQPDAVRGFIGKALADYEKGLGLAFATIDKASNTVVGSTRYMKSDLHNKRTEIGSTFLARSYQRTGINTEAKLLMLEHAFETLNLNRVEFLTDYLNSKSRAAIARLGAKEEGILRNHMVMPDGRIRDTAIYSIIHNEWPGIKQHLYYQLNRR